jgi:hypothetical protein
VPANRFNAFTDYGVGIGLRVPHYDHIFSERPVVDWFEIISENYMVDGAEAGIFVGGCDRRSIRRHQIFRRRKGPQDPRVFYPRIRTGLALPRAVQLILTGDRE